jgi:ABC-type amino acid transport substrate-binding protein
MEAASRSRRRAALTALLLLACATGAAAEPATGLRLGSDTWPPFTAEPGRPRVAIALVEAALSRDGVEAGTAILPDFAQVMEQIRSGQLDGSAALWRTPEREALLRFSHPYLENRLVLLARKGTDLGATRLSQLAGRRVAIVESYAYGPEVEQAEGPVLVRGPSDRANLQLLLQGKVDYLLADELLIHDLFERQGERARVLLAAGTAPIVQRSLHLALRRDLPGSEQIIARFDEAIRAMLADGSFNRILGVTWIRADVDGDGKPELVLGADRAGTQAPDGAYEIFRSGAEPAGGERYVVDGKAYETWEKIPPNYRVQSERSGKPPPQGLRLLEF